MLLMDINFCSNTSDLWQIVGMFLLIFKIVIPIILIIWGMIDLGKAVIASDDKAISKAAKSLLMRAIAAVAIFFIPTIVGFIFSLVGSFQADGQSDFNICKECLVHPNGDKCKVCIENPNSADCLKTAEK